MIVTPDQTKFVNSTVSALRTQLGDCSADEKRGVLEELLSLLRQLKTSRHPAAAPLAAAVGRDIIPLFEAGSEASDRYQFELEETRVADVIARHAAGSMSVFRATDYIKDPLPYAAAFRFWQPPCFMSPEFEDGLRDLFLDILRTAGRTQLAEANFYKPLAEAAGDEVALESVAENIRPNAVRFLMDTMAGIRKNDRPYQYLCLERLKSHSIRNRYHLYNDLDFAFLESVIQLPEIQVQRIHKKVQEAWDRDLSREQFVAELESLEAESDSYILDCAILSAFYHRQGCRMDFSALYHTLIGAERSIEVAQSFRVVLTGELMRIPNRLAYELAEGDEGQAADRFDLLVAVLAAIGKAELPGLEDQILALIWGRDDLRELIDWINRGYPAEDLPKLLEVARETAQRKQA